jgi:hypothetical protein
MVQPAPKASFFENSTHTRSVLAMRLARFCNGTGQTHALARRNSQNSANFVAAFLSEPRNSQPARASERVKIMGFCTYQRDFPETRTKFAPEPRHFPRRQRQFCTTPTRAVPKWRRPSATSRALIGWHAQGPPQGVVALQRESPRPAQTWACHTDSSPLSSPPHPPASAAQTSAAQAPSTGPAAATESAPRARTCTWQFPRSTARSAARTAASCCQCPDRE